jgi:hypothetical protein
VAPLDRAVALAEVDGVAVAVGEHLISTWRGRTIAFSK